MLSAFWYCPSKVQRALLYCGTATWLPEGDLSCHLLRLRSTILHNTFYVWNFNVFSKDLLALCLVSGDETWMYRCRLRVSGVCCQIDVVYWRPVKLVCHSSWHSWCNPTNSQYSPHTGSGCDLFICCPARFSSTFLITLDSMEVSLPHWHASATCPYP